MDLEQYTSYDDVRAALGVSSDEIADTTLALDLYVFNLISELEGISLGLIPAYNLQKETTPDNWTDDQNRLHQSVRLFSAYAVAKLATVSLPMFAPKDQTDGKASIGRFATDPYKATIARVLAQYEIFKKKLDDAYGAVVDTGSPAVTTRPYFSVVSPNYDPVLGV